MREIKDTVVSQEVYDGLSLLGGEIPFQADEEHERFNSVVEYLRLNGIIKSYKESAEKIGESPVGLNDIKNGRKRVSTRVVKNMRKSYHYIRSDYILFSDGFAFEDDVLMNAIPDGKTNNPQAGILTIDMDSLDNYSFRGQELTEETNVDTKDGNQGLMQLLKELNDLKSELISAKDQIIDLQNKSMI